MQPDLTPCYIGRKACGCVVAAAVINADHATHTAREIAQWKREGLDVEVSTVEEARKTLRPCRCGKPPVQKERRARQLVLEVPDAA